MACGDLKLFSKELETIIGTHMTQPVAEFTIYIATNTRCRRLVLVDRAADWGNTTRPRIMELFNKRRQRCTVHRIQIFFALHQGI